MSDRETLYPAIIIGIAIVLGSYTLQPGRFGLIASANGPVYKIDKHTGQVWLCHAKCQSLSDDGPLLSEVNSGGKTWAENYLESQRVGEVSNVQ